MTIMRTGLAVLTLALITTTTAPPPADATGWRRQHAAELDRGYAIARSRYGNGTVSGPIRHTSVGPQVRLPGGTWEYCRRLCSETLRVESIDFWDSRQDGIVSDECGVFGCLELRFGY